MRFHRSLRWLLACSVAASLGTAYAGPEECLTLRDNARRCRMRRQVRAGNIGNRRADRAAAGPASHRPLSRPSRWPNSRCSFRCRPPRLAPSRRKPNRRQSSPSAIAPNSSAAAKWRHRFGRPGARVRLCALARIGGQDVRVLRHPGRSRRRRLQALLPGRLKTGRPAPRRAIPAGAGRVAAEHRSRHPGNRVKSIRTQRPRRWPVRRATAACRQRPSP